MTYGRRTVLTLKTYKTAKNAYFGKSHINGFILKVMFILVKSSPLNDFLTAFLTCLDPKLLTNFHSRPRAIWTGRVLPLRAQKSAGLEIPHFTHIHLNTFRNLKFSVLSLCTNRCVCGRPCPAKRTEMTRLSLLYGSSQDNLHCS